MDEFYSLLDYQIKLKFEKKIKPFRYPKLYDNFTM